MNGSRRRSISGPPNTRERKGRWKAVNSLREGLIYMVRLEGGRVRQRPMVATEVKQFHIRPDDIRHLFDDEFALTVWGLDLGVPRYRCRPRGCTR